jgi:hypothetical protein
MIRASFVPCLPLVLVAALGSTGCSYRSHVRYGCRYAHARAAVVLPPPAPPEVPPSAEIAPQPAFPAVPNQVVVRAPPGTTVIVVTQPGGGPPVVRTVPAPQPQPAPQPALQPSAPQQENPGWSDEE